MRDPFLRTPYNYDMNEAGDESGINNTEPSMTHQSMAEECDINTIIKRFGLSGELPVNQRMPTYGDFTQVTDFQTAMNAITEAREAFMSMPADIRARFHNDPAEFVDFCSDDTNMSEARKLGLIPEAEVIKAGELTQPTAPSEPVRPSIP